MRQDEIPQSLRDRLPEFLLYIVDPQALAALSLADLEEIADAWEQDELYFVNEVRIEESGGPLEPALAQLVLQIPQGAPYIEKRFNRIAKSAYGNGIFSFLEWEVYRNADDSVDIHLRYRSNKAKNWIPEPGSNALAGFLYGVRYEDRFYKNTNRSISYGLQWAGEDPAEPRIFYSTTNNTLNGGRNSQSVSASVGNDWRRRNRGDADSIADLRDRTARVDYAYSWNRNLKLFGKQGSTGVGAGIYGQDQFIIGGDPTDGGEAPRSDFDQSGEAGYVSVFWGSANRDKIFTPQEGHSYSLRLEQHVGDWDFTRFTADFRKYKAADNILGIEPEVPTMDGHTYSAVRMFPAASVAVQLQATAANGNVPYSWEVRPGSSSNVRGYQFDNVVGTKLIGARGEYRFALDENRKNEAFFFSDHAVYGERFSDLENLDSFGFGGLFTLPIYGGFKVGAYNAWTYDGSDSQWGISLGYQF